MNDIDKPMTKKQAYVLMVLLVIMTLVFFWSRMADIMASQHSLRTSCQLQYLAAVYAMHESHVSPWTDYLTSGRAPNEVLELPQCKSALKQ
jgi:hypothetical protein